MAHASSADRSRSPKVGDKADPEDGSVGDGLDGLDGNFVKLWAKHVEPKLADHVKQAAEKNKEFEGEIKKVVGVFVKTEVDRLEKKMDAEFAEIETLYGWFCNSFG